MIKDLINAIAEGDSIAIEDNFNAVMASKISGRLDDMRVSVAQGMFGSVEESYDSSDAYETWDPKHPKFKEKLIKHHAKGGTTQSFIDQEKAKAKKKLTKEEVELEELTLEDYSVEELEDFMVSEDFDQLDELSKATLGSYVKKASGKLASHGTNLMGSVGNFNIKNAEYHGTKIDKRQKGISKAVDKMTKEEFTLEDYSIDELEDFMMSEDFEQLDELSKKTLGSYVKKANTNAIVNGEKLGGGARWTDSGRIALKREKGISKAVDKMTKEAVEELDELSTRTHMSYRGKSTFKTNNMLKKVGTNPEWPIPTKDIIHSAREKMSPEDQKVFDKRSAGVQKSYKKTGLGVGSAAHTSKSSDRHSGL